MHNLTSKLFKKTFPGGRPPDPSYMVVAINEPKATGHPFITSWICPPQRVLLLLKSVRGDLRI